MSSIRTLRNKIFRRETAPAILIVVNTFVWYILTYVVFSNIIKLNVVENERLEIFTAYFLAIAVTAIIGSKVSSSSARSFYLYGCSWSYRYFTFCLISANNVIINVLIGSFFGASIGIGLPSCLSYFAKSTSIETRGFTGGLTWSGVGITVLHLFLISVSGLGSNHLLAIWRLIGGIGFFGLNRKHKKTEVQKSPSYFELIRKREILLYLFPWTMFSLINFAETPILAKRFWRRNICFYSACGVCYHRDFRSCGWHCSRYCWKKTSSNCRLHNVRNRICYNEFVFQFASAIYLFLTLDGITWGLLFSVFFTVVWGDLR